MYSYGTVRFARISTNTFVVEMCVADRNVCWRHSAKRPSSRRHKKLKIEVLI
jgi:hypothetical protein